MPTGGGHGALRRVNGADRTARASWRGRAGGVLPAGHAKGGGGINHGRTAFLLDGVLVLLLGVLLDLFGGGASALLLSLLVVLHDGGIQSFHLLLSLLLLVLQEILIEGTHALAAGTDGTRRDALLLALGNAGLTSLESMLELAGAERGTPSSRGRDGGHLEAGGAIGLDDVDPLGNGATHLASVGEQSNADDENTENVGADDAADLGGEVGLVAEGTFCTGGGVDVEVDVEVSWRGEGCWGEKSCSEGCEGSWSSHGLVGQITAAPTGGLEL